MTPPVEVHPIDSGSVRSRKEAIAAMGTRRCGVCGGSEVFQWKEEVPAGADHVYAGRATCNECGLRWSHRFQAGPGWDDQPGEDDPRFASTVKPSTIFPEATFRKWLDVNARALRHLKPPSADAGADEREEHEDERRMHAREGLSALLEIEKHRAAVGERLDDELRTLRGWLIEQFVASGGTLPPGLE
jgi:hypothetical protein